MVRLSIPRRCVIGALRNSVFKLSVGVTRSLSMIFQAEFKGKEELKVLLLG